MEHPFTAYPKYLYHATLAPVIVYTLLDENEARANGYVDTYQPQYSPEQPMDEALAGDKAETGSPLVPVEKPEDKDEA